MVKDDIYQKSALGREEIKNKNLDMLPREARTLLIMIDGNKTYAQYLATLDESKMFVETGGIAPLFALLEDMGLIECLEPTQTSADSEALSSESDLESSSNESIESLAEPLQSTEPDVTSAPQPATSENIEVESTVSNSTTDESRKTSKASSMFGGFFKSKNKGVNHKAIKSDLAAHVEKNSPDDDTWGHLLDLQHCNDDAKLLSFAKKLQSLDNSPLSNDMDKFIKAIENQN